MRRIGNEPRRMRRSWLGALLALVFIALITTPTPALGQLLFSADFNADTSGAPPNPSPPGPPTGDSITLDNVQGGDSILVQGPAGGFVNNSVRIFHPQGFGNAPALLAHPVQGTHNNGRFVVSWKALLGNHRPVGQATLFSPGGAPAFTVRHQAERHHRIQGGSGLVPDGHPLRPVRAADLHRRGKASRSNLRPRRRRHQGRMRATGPERPVHRARPLRLPCPGPHDARRCGVRARRHHDHEEHARAPTSRRS